MVTGEVVPDGGEGAPQGIPDFWSKVFSSHEAFEELLSDKDCEYLKHLKDVSVERYEASEEGKMQRWAVKLIFTFMPNDFMEETELTKIYYFADPRESIAISAEGCNITWKSGALRPCHLVQAHTSATQLCLRWLLFTGQARSAADAPSTHASSPCASSTHRTGVWPMRHTRACSSNILHAGKDPTKKHLRKPDGKGGFLRKTKELPSMFRFFEPPQVPQDEALSGEQEQQLEEARRCVSVSISARALCLLLRVLCSTGALRHACPFNTCWSW